MQADENSHSAHSIREECIGQVQEAQGEISIQGSNLGR